MVDLGESSSLARRATRRSLHAIGRAAFSRDRVRRRVDRSYRGWSFSGQRRFHRYFAKAFRSGSSKPEPGAWSVEFAGREISLPLRPERMWLDWDNALSVLGHDIEVKETYARCLRSPSPPELFLDVGANYGLHSLLFLAHGVEVITFEPNPACHDDFRVLCDRNGVAGRIEGVALGEHRGEVELVYPERETWLGTTRSTRGRAPAEGARAQRVPQRTLDDYGAELAGRRALVKLDTEGSECEVVAGGRRTLEDARPLLIFESLRDRSRERLWELLAELRYDVAVLPWAPERPGEPIDRLSFLESAAENFIAIPRASRT